MASGDPPRWTSQLARYLRGNPHGDAIWSCVISTINATVFAREHDLEADLSDTDVHLPFFAGALEYAIHPHARCLPHAGHLGLYTRANALNRATKEIKGNVRDGEWLLMYLHAPLLS